MCYQMLAVKSLKDESMRVYEELKKQDLPGQKCGFHDRWERYQKSVCSRCDKSGSRDCAENTSDGIIAPLFYMAIGGLPDVSV